ncbi:MAG: glycosyltransferase [Clostridiales bacterium]|nr:glycosyltransferase [Clostridiales bacterium]
MEEILEEQSKQREFSVLMSVYKNTKLSELKECLDSLENQTVKATEYVIVRDGQVSSELNDYLDSLENDLSGCKIIRLEQNVGLGNALKEGMAHCSNEIIARMDTDDICVKNRFEEQLDCFENDEELSIVGSNIAEFIDSVSNVVSYRNVPRDHDDICEYLKKRCPFNHMTVMFKKTDVEKAGGYLHWHYNEDSYLWVRMYLAGAKFYNIQENLVCARIDESTFARRGGYKYYKSERDLFKYMYKNKIIGFGSYVKAKTIRFILYVLMPNRMRQWAYKKFARK